MVEKMVGAMAAMTVDAKVDARVAMRDYLDLNLGL